jgi:DNA integrity scanning protein DisA with diadenylate cyclase activity
VYGLAVQLSKVTEADALVVLLEGPTDWEQLKKRAGKETIVIAAHQEEQVTGATDVGLDVILLNMVDAPVYERLSHALLMSVADEILSPGSGVVAVYSGFEQGQIDTISHIRLADHLGRLTARDLRQLATHVPLDTLKVVVDMAVEIGREGREGKPVGTMFVVGDSRKVQASSQSTGFDPVRGYNRKERNLHDPRVREGIKEIAQLDGAFLVSSQGIIESSCRLVDASAANITMSKGLGTRHWAAAAITKKTSAVAVVVSESSGTVRIFQNGEVVLRIEPFRRAMKWKDFEYEPPSATSE